MFYKYLKHVNLRKKELCNRLHNYENVTTEKKYSPSNNVVFQ